MLRRPPPAAKRQLGRTLCAYCAIAVSRRRISRRGGISSRARRRPASRRGPWACSGRAPRHRTLSSSPPPYTGRPGRRYVIRNAYVMTMEPGTPGADSTFGEFIEGDVLVDGKKIVAIGKNLHVGNAAEIDARGKVVMPGFIDTHHHQAWTAIRSSIPDSILINDGTGTASAEQNYFVNVLGFGAHRARASPTTTRRRTSTSASCSAGSRSSMPASRRCSTSRRSITRRSTPTGGDPGSA